MFLKCQKLEIVFYFWFYSILDDELLVSFCSLIWKETQKTIIIIKVKSCFNWLVKSRTPLRKLQNWSISVNQTTCPIRLMYNLIKFGTFFTFCKINYTLQCNSVSQIFPCGPMDLMPKQVFNKCRSETDYYRMELCLVLSLVGWSLVMFKFKINNKVRALSTVHRL